MIRIIAVLLLLAGPALATQDARPALYDVHGVAANDVLNVRAGPSGSAAIVGVLAPDATGVEVVATTDDLRWGRVNIGEGSGWVAMRFMAIQPGFFQGRFPAPATCFGTEPFWSMTVGVDGIDFTPLDGPALRFGAGTREGARGRRDRWSVRAFRDGRSLSVVIGTASCHDGMSDRTFGLTGDVLISTKAGHVHHTGCCSLLP